VYVGGDRQPTAFEENPNESLTGAANLNFGLIQPGQSAARSIPVTPATNATKFTIANARAAGFDPANIVATPLGNLQTGLSFEASISNLSSAVVVTVTNYSQNPINPDTPSVDGPCEERFCPIHRSEPGDGSNLPRRCLLQCPQNQWVPLTDAGSYERPAEKITAMTRIAANGSVRVSATNVATVVQNGDQVYVYGVTGLPLDGLWTVSGVTSTNGNNGTNQTLILTIVMFRWAHRRASVPGRVLSTSRQ